MVGIVLGWPTLDHPSSPKGEGLGWMNTPDGFFYSRLNVTLPRLDLPRKEEYMVRSARYQQSGGTIGTLTDDVTGDSFRFIDEAGARTLRAAAMIAGRIPVGRAEPIGLSQFCLNPR